MSTITIEQWTDYLNRKTQGFNCPICGRNRWQTQPDDDGNVLDAMITDHSNTPKTDEFARPVLGRDGGVEKPRPASLLKSCNIIRCGHCGWIGLFDRTFVEEHLDDEE